MLEMLSRLCFKVFIFYISKASFLLLIRVILKHKTRSSSISSFLISRAHTRSFMLLIHLTWSKFCSLEVSVRLGIPLVTVLPISSCLCILGWILLDLCGVLSWGRSLALRTIRTSLSLLLIEINTRWSSFSDYKWAHHRGIWLRIVSCCFWIRHSRKLIVRALFARSSSIIFVISVVIRWRLLLCITY